ncbi:MAG: transcription termination/antitermination protein NusG [Acidobacteria bacterium]|nr:transcription termination/antitermination protein NusG [Acidobacteriota bacterium]
MSETATKAPAEHRWYVIHTYSGYEGKVRESLIERMKSAGFAEMISEVLVPSEEIVELKKGKRRVSERKVFPGYVLVKMDLNDETWHLVQETPRITGFVGGRTTPTPLTEAEVQAIVDQTKTEDGKPGYGVSFRVGENIRVVDGPFTNFVGVIDQVNQERGKLRVMVSIFGRSTPVELDFLQAEKL